MGVATAALGLGGLAACGGSGGQEGAGATPSTSGEPRTGGVLTFAEFSSPVGLDPIVMTGSGTTGLTESYAVYDSLLRYDVATGSYGPGTADSAVPNDDHTEWTITLHPGIRFTDGTDYDAAAVAFALNRFRSGQPGAPACADIVACPRNSTSSSFSATFIRDVAVVDPLTVKVTLKQSWAGFRTALASELGLVPSPTALKKCDAAAPVNQCAFNTAPVGAGPFIVTSFKAGEGITMARNPDYWGGQVYLDGLKFINLQDGGGAKTYDALKAGQAQAAFLRDPEVVAQAQKAEQPGFANPTFGAQILLVNSVSPTAPTANAAVRRAVAAAIDPRVVNQRSYAGTARPSGQLLPPEFRWYPDVPGPTYDAELAKRLVAEAKAAGWDGHIRLLSNNAPASANGALAIQAMLQAAGMTVALDNARDIAGATALIVKKDYDLALAGMAAGNNESAEVQLSQYLSSTSPSGLGLNDPQLDAAIAQLFAASSDADIKAGYAAVMRIVVDKLPILALNSFDEYIAWSPQVHGVTPGIKTTATFAKAWIG